MGARWLEQSSSGLLRFGLGLGTAILAASGCILALALLANVEDILRAYPSPERHENVRLISSADSRGWESEDACLLRSGDFDGDAFDDSLEVEYFHMEPLFRAATSGMVRVRSGRDGSQLLAHAVPTPLTHVAWQGDLDGNGTDEVEIDDGTRRCTFGIMAKR